MKKLPAKKELFAPEELKAALASDKKANATFGKFSNSQKREYAEWISEAKTEAAKNKRIATALDRMAQGKPRHRKNIREK